MGIYLMRCDKLTYLFAILAVPVLLLSCQRPDSIPYPATIRPLAFLIERLAGSRLSNALVHPGRNPETYDPSVADMLQYRDCRLLFYVSDTLDGWAANFQECPAEAILHRAAFSNDNDGGLKADPGSSSANRNRTGDARDQELPGGPSDGPHLHSFDPFQHGHHHSHGMDPHFWTDPHRIAEILPRLESLFHRVDPESSGRIAQESAILGKQLYEMENMASVRLKHLEGKRAVLMHPTYQSFLEEHGLIIVAVVEPLPGRELSVKEWRWLLNQKPVDIVVHERQLPKRSAQILADALDAKIVELDPMGYRARNLTELLENQMDALAALRF